MVIFMITTWCLSFFFSLHAQIDLQHLMLLHNQIEMVSTVHNPLSVDQTRDYVVGLKSILEKPYMHVMTLLADSYGLLFIDDATLLARVTGHHDEEILERARLWCLRLISKYAVAFADNGSLSDMYHVIATKIQDDTAGMAAPPQPAFITRHTGMPHGGIPILCAAVVGSLLCGLYAYKRVQSRIDERDHCADSSFKKVDQRMTALAQTHAKDLLTHKQEYEVMQRRVYDIQDDVRSTNENLADQARGVSRVMRAGFEAQEHERLRLTEYVDTFSHGMITQQQAQDQALKQLTSSVVQHTTQVENRIGGVAQSLQNLKQYVDNRVLLVSNAHDAITERMDQCEHAYQQMEKICKKHKEDSARVERQISTLHRDIQTVRQQPLLAAPEAQGTFKKVMEGMTNAGDALYSIGRGVSSIRRVFVPAEDVIQSVLGKLKD